MLRQAKIIIKLIGNIYVVAVVLIVALAIFSSSLYISTGYSIIKTVLDIVEGPIKLPRIVNRNALSIYTSRIPVIALTPLYNISSNAGFFASITIASSHNKLLIVLGLDEKGYGALGLSNYTGKIILGHKLAKRLGVNSPNRLLLLNGILAKSHVIVRIDAILEMPDRLNEVLIAPLSLSQELQQRPFSVVSAFYILDDKILDYINKFYKVYISIPQSGILQIFSIDGKLLYNRTVRGSIELRLPLGYYIVIFNNGKDRVISNVVPLFKDTSLNIYLLNASKWARIFFLDGETQANVIHNLREEKELNYIVFYAEQGKNTIVLNNSVYRDIIVRADTIISAEAIRSLTPRTCIQIKYWNGTPYTGLIEIDYREKAYILDVNKGMICSYISNYKLRLLSVSGEITYAIEKPSNKTIIIPPHRLLARVPVDLLLSYLSSKTIIESIIGILGSSMILILAVLMAYSILIIPLPYIIVDNIFNEIFNKIMKLKYLGADEERITRLVARTVFIIMISSIIVSAVLSLLSIVLAKLNALLLVYELDINDTIVTMVNIGVGIVYLIITYMRVHR